MRKNNGYRTESEVERKKRNSIAVYTSLKTKEGREIGSIESQGGPKRHTVLSSHIQSRHQGKGLGKLLYEKHIHHLHKIGVEHLKASDGISVGADRTWKSVIKEHGGKIHPPQYRGNSKQRFEVLGNHSIPTKNLKDLR